MAPFFFSEDIEAVPDKPDRPAVRLEQAEFQHERMIRFFCNKQGERREVTDLRRRPNGDWDAAGWEAEEQLRAALMHRALELVSEEDLGLLLAQVNAQAFEAIELGVHEAAALFDNDDPALVDLAIGSAAQICHLAGLWV